MLDILNDEYYMDMALTLAGKASGQTGINPVVGCVIVKDGRIVGLGAHLKRGEGHAEVHAVRMAGDEACGATAYVTLEPCSHFGKTPPCCELLIQKGVKRVVVSTTDPNPLVAGNGIRRLQEAGISVTSGVLEQRARQLNEKFNKYIMTKKPFVTLKSASTLDGKLATSTGHSQWISGELARQEVHMLRHQHQGIMVGIGTILADNPSLTTRADVEGLHPTKIVVDSMLKIPLDAKVVTDHANQLIVVSTAKADFVKKEQLEQLGASVLICGEGPKVDLQEAMVQLGELEISSILLEGGGHLNGEMLAHQLVDKIIVYYGPKIVGGKQSPSLFQFEGIETMDKAIVLDQMQAEVIGRDIRVTGYPLYH